MSLEKCPQCGQPRASSTWRLCSCGYDFGPGASPEKPKPRLPQNSEDSLKGFLSGFLRRALAIGFLASTCLSGVYAIKAVQAHRQFLANAVGTTGYIVELRTTQGGRGHTFDLPVFSFRDAAGQEYAIHSNIRRRRNQYWVGQTVPVLYRPDRPIDAEIDDLLTVGAQAFLMGMFTLLQAGAWLSLWLGPRLASRFRIGSPSAVRA